MDVGISLLFLPASRHDLRIHKYSKLPDVAGGGNQLSMSLHYDHLYQYFEKWEGKCLGRDIPFYH